MPVSQNVSMPRAWLLLFLLLFVAGCDKTNQWGGEWSKDAPRTVVSLSPSTTELVGLNGNTGQLVGRTTSCNFPGDAKNLEVYGSVKPDYEKIAAKKPSLIVLDPELYAPAEIEKIRSLGVKVFEFRSGTFNEYLTAVKDLGKATEAAMMTSQYVDKIQHEIAKAKANGPAKAPRVAVASGTMIVGTKSFLAEAVRLAGGEPVGPDSNQFVAMNPEVLIQGNPDIIFVAADVVQYQGDKEKQLAIAREAINRIAADPRFKGLSAVKSRRVVPIDADVLLRRGARVDRLLAGLAEEIQKVEAN